MSDLGNKKIISKNISRLMNERGITRNQISDDLNIKYTTLTDWIKGNTYPRIDSIEKLANYFNVQKSDLVERKPTNISRVATVSIPVLGQIACGDPITADENIDGYRDEVSAQLPSGNLFYLKCKGRSMEPTIPDSSYVLIHEQPEVEDGEIAAVLVDDDTEATLKRVKRSGDSVILMPDNNKFSPIILSKKQPGRIIGKAVKFSVDL